MPTRSRRPARTTFYSVLVVGVLAVASAVTTGHLDVSGLLDQATTTSAPAANAPDSTPGHITGDYYEVVGKAREPYQPKETGEVEYCPADRLGRAVCAYGELTSSLRRQAQARGRQDIDVDPAGWPDDNREVTIKALSNVPGSDTYHGWMWNRSHLVADSLGGDPIEANLVTGTRTQNVGSAQTDGEYSGGMAHTERIARSYLDHHDGDACPLYYAATPKYHGSDLIPFEVVVDMRSCDGSIDQRVIVENSANGWAVDYANGSYAPAG